MFLNLDPDKDSRPAFILKRILDLSQSSIKHLHYDISDIKFQQNSSSILNNIKLLTSTFPIIIILFMGPNQTKFISMGPIWNTSGTETVISVPVSVLGPERAGTEMGCIRSKCVCTQRFLSSLRQT